MICLKDISVGYTKSLLVAKEIYLELGSVYALIGRNGIGKSTLIQSLSGAIPLLSGEILIGNKKLCEIPRENLVKLISVVESRFEGLEYLSVKDYLALGRSPHTDSFGRMTQVDLEVVQKVSEEMDISYLLEKFTDQISDGERQLCAVARAFVQDTPIVLLDEPTAFLDYINRKKLLTLLVKLAELKQKCILLSTHDLELCLVQALPMLLATPGNLSLHSKLSKEEVLQEMEKN